MADGRVVFVRNSLPGELVTARVSEETARFVRAEALEILEASPDRVSPPCRHAGPGGCGGCDLQHATESAQLAWKSALVREHFRRIAHLELDLSVEAVGPARGARTRLRCVPDANGRLALRAPRSHDLVALDECWIADERFADAFATTWFDADEVELRAIGEGEPFAVLRRDGEATVSLRSLSGAPMDPRTHSRVNVGSHVFSVWPRSFWQSHRAAPTVLTDFVMGAAELVDGDRAVDLYSGVGLFSVPMARAVGARGKVSAVESSPYAVRDARVNADGLTQVKIREWSVTPRAINDVVQEDDVVVLDPPRQGLGRGVAEALIRRRPRRLVYVSCDPATLARDVAQLTAGGFRMGQIRAWDLFPMTEHVEMGVCLDRDDS